MTYLGFLLEIISLNLHGLLTCIHLGLVQGLFDMLVFLVRIQDAKAAVHLSTLIGKSEVIVNLRLLPSEHFLNCIEDMRASLQFPLELSFHF